MSKNIQRKLVIEADELGLSYSYNRGISEAYKNGLLTSTCIRTNGSAFDEAVEEIIPDCSGLNVGLHLNIVEGQSDRIHIPSSTKLYDSSGRYKMSFKSLLKSSFSRDKTVFEEVEADFRFQIEKTLDRGIVPDHLNSHMHFHTIPRVFEIVCQLAVEYKIPYVRLPREQFYFGESMGFHLAPWYPLNLAKIMVVDFFARQNSRTAKRLGVQTNDYFVGIGYTGHMTSMTVKRGLSRLGKMRSGIVEVLLHPCISDPAREDIYIAPSLQAYMTDPARRIELAALLDPELHRFIEADEWELTSYSGLVNQETQSNGSSTAALEDANLSSF